MSRYRIMFSAPKSGCGKTMVTLAVVGAMKKSGLNTVAFKCGPDYIDPMFHSKVTGTPCRNLDLFMSDKNMVRKIFSDNSKNCDFSVIEGAMGYYDGLAGTTTTGSAYETAVTLETDTVLIVDGKNSAITLAAEIYGMKNFKSDSRIKGVIINRVNGQTYSMLKKCIEAETKIKVLGYLPQLENLGIDSRYLGLKTPESIENFSLKAETLFAAAMKYIDIEELKKIAYNDSRITYEDIYIPCLEESVKIACAGDNAFNFYYEDNLELLNKMGAEIKFFSPLSDEKIPDDSDGILIGGGYPELFGQILSKNQNSIESIISAAENQIPIIAECGGYMYLCKSMYNGEKYKMTGLFDIDTWKTDKLNRFGYITMTSEKDSIFGRKGTVINGHEFHYFDSSDNGHGFLAVKPVSEKSWYCGHLNENIYAGFPHLYFYSNIEATYCFLKKCLEYKRRRNVI